MDDISKRIAEILDRSGLSHSEFASRLGVSGATISHLLSGRNKPSLQVLTRIKREFTNVNWDYLLLGEGALFNEDKPEKSVHPGSVGNAAAGFPMEGVRRVNVSGVPSPGAKAKTEIDTSDNNSKADVTENRLSEELKEGSIERVIILFKDGSFKAYRP